MLFLYRVCDALQRARVPFAVAGGYAVALHGAVRGTVDVDIVLRLKREDFLSAEKALQDVGLSSRLPVSAAEVFDFREEYIRNRNLIAWSFFNPANPTEIVDLIITHDLAKIDVKRIAAGGKQIPVVSLEDLIAMKKASGRPQDVEDVKALERIKR